MKRIAYIIASPAEFALHRHRRGETQEDDEPEFMDAAVVTGWIT